MVRYLAPVNLLITLGQSLISWLSFILKCPCYSNYSFYYQIILIICMYLQRFSVRMWVRFEIGCN